MAVNGLSLFLLFYTSSNYRRRTTLISHIGCIFPDSFDCQHRNSACKVTNFFRDSQIFQHQFTDFSDLSVFFAVFTALRYSMICFEQHAF